MMLLMLSLVNDTWTLDWHLLPWLHSLCMNTLQVHSRLYPR